MGPAQLTDGGCHGLGVEAHRRNRGGRPTFGGPRFLWLAANQSRWGKGN